MEKIRKNKVFIVDSISMMMLEKDEEMKPMLDKIAESGDDEDITDIVNKLENIIKTKYGVEEIVFAN